MTAADDLTHVALEGAALAHAQHLLIFNPTPEVDSLAERIATLRQHGVPRPLVRDLLHDARRLLDFAHRQRECHARLAGDLDRFNQADAKLTDAITVRGLVRALRDPLDKLLAPEQAGAAELVTSREIVRNLISTTPVERLRSETLAHELGGRRHRLLLDLIEAQHA